MDKSQQFHVKRGSPFEDRLDRSGGPGACCPYLGRCTHDGYGHYWTEGHDVSAHRYALEQSLGRSLVPGAYACHRCNNPPCCSPAHLYEGDEYTNWLDSIAHDAADAEERSRVGAVRWATRRANAARRTKGDGWCGTAPANPAHV